MVDPQVRRHLRDSLAQLLEGQITTDEFSNIYWEMSQMPDLGLVEIARFGWGLYSDDMLWESTRLQGKEAVSPEDRQIVDRCLQFLETDLEFRWPKMVDHTFRWLFISSLFLIPAAFGYILGAVVLILALVQVFYIGWSVLWLVLTGLTLLTPSVVLTWLCDRYDQRRRRREWNGYRQNGDWEVWPFFTQAEYQRAAK